jgi:hypothetical protein
VPVRVVVEAESKDGISDEQRAAYVAFKRNAKIVFENAQRESAAMLRKRGITSLDFEDTERRRPVRLRLTDPHTIHVLRVRRGELSYVGLECACVWDGEHGVGFVTHGADVVAVGEAAIAFDPYASAFTKRTLERARAKSSRWRVEGRRKSAGTPKPRRKTSAERSELTLLLDSYGDRVRVRELVHRERGTFWRIELAKPESYARFVVYEGKLGSGGRRTMHAYDDWPSFAVAVRTAITRRLRAGYVEVTHRPKLGVKDREDIRPLDSHYSGPRS